MIYITPYNTFRIISASEREKIVLSKTDPYRKVEGVYTQKVQLGDNPIMHLHIQAAGNLVTLRYITCSEQTLFTETMLVDPLYPKYTRDGIEYDCYTKKGLPSLLLDKTFYIEITVSNNNGNVVLLTEPINYQTKQPENTKLFTCKNKENKGFATFEQSNLKFSLRVEAEITQNTPSVDKVVYTDMEHNPVLLSATAYDTWKFDIGSNSFGVPDWVLEKLNYFMHTDEFKYEGIAYVATDESTLSIQAENKYALRFAEINFRRAIQLSGYMNSFRNFTIANFTYPFVYVHTKFKENGITQYLNVSKRIINNATELQALLDEINTESGLELYSQFPNSINASGQISPQGDVEFYFLDKIVNIANTGSASGNLYLGGLGGKVAIVDSLSNIVRLEGVGANTANIALSGFTSNFKMYHSDNVTYMQFHTVAGLQGLSNLPKPLETLVCFNCIGLTTVPFSSWLSTCSQNIRVVRLTGCANLTSVSSYIDAGIANYPYLKEIYVNNCNLTLTSKNNFVNSMGDAAYIGKVVVSGVVVNMTGNPSAAYNSTSLWARQFLASNFSWQIT